MSKIYNVTFMRRGEIKLRELILYYGKLQPQAKLPFSEMNDHIMSNRLEIFDLPNGDKADRKSVV